MKKIAIYLKKTGVFVSLRIGLIRILLDKPKSVMLKDCISECCMFHRNKQKQMNGSICAKMKQEMDSFYFKGVSASTAILVVEKEGTPIWNEFEWDCAWLWHIMMSVCCQPFKSLFSKMNYFEC